MGVDRFGDSRAARTFGASLEVTNPGHGLYLVVSSEGSPASAVTGAGGDVIVSIGDRKVLAMLSFEGHLLVGQRPEVALVGPVVMDPQRFSRFVNLIALDSEVADNRSPSR